MISMRVDTRTKNKAAFDAIYKKLNAAKDKAYRQRVFYMFKEMLNVSYQFSGDFTSNWRIVTSAGELAPYKQWPGKTGTIGDAPHQAGDPEAINFAFTRAKFQKFGAKDKVFFVNSTPLEFTGTTVTGPDGVTTNLRPENIIGNGERIQSYMKSKFGGR